MRVEDPNYQKFLQDRFSGLQCHIGVTQSQVLAAHHDVPLQQLRWLQHKVELVRLGLGDVAAKHKTRLVDSLEVQVQFPMFSGKTGGRHLLNCRRADGLQTLVDSQEKATSWEGGRSKTVKDTFKENELKTDKTAPDFKMFPLSWKR